MGNKSEISPHTITLQICTRGSTISKKHKKWRKAMQIGKEEIKTRFIHKCHNCLHINDISLKIAKIKSWDKQSYIT